MSAARRNPPLYYSNRVFPQDDVRVHGDLDYMPGGIGLVGHGKSPEKNFLNFHLTFGISLNRNSLLILIIVQIIGGSEVP